MPVIMYVAFAVFMFCAPSMALKITTRTNYVGNPPQDKQPKQERSLDADISHDAAEWEALTKTFNTKPAIPKTHGEQVCLLGAAVPELYLLGQQKAGTTTFAADAFRLGFKSAINNTKELHTFDAHCNFHTEQKRPRHEWMSNGAPIEQCKKMSDSEKETWAKRFEPCGSSPSTALVDMTPLNFRIPGLPAVMSDLYGEKQLQLRFAVLLREPLSRFQSGWYHMGGSSKFNTTFEEHVDLAVSMAKKMDHQSIDQDYFLDEFSRSMYSLSMKHWLKAFRPEQFIIIPSSLYFTNATYKASLMRHISYQLGMEVDTTVLQTETLQHTNLGEHPALSEDLSSSRIEILQAQYYDPDTNELCKMLAEAIPKGLRIYGFEGRSTQSDIKSYLTSSW